jgi:hypothetical protein
MCVRVYGVACACGISTLHKLCAMGTEESEHPLRGLVRKERSLRSYQPSALSPHALRRHLRLRHLLAHLCSTSKKKERRTQRKGEEES